MADRISVIVPLGLAQSLVDDAHLAPASELVERGRRGEVGDSCLLHWCRGTCVYHTCIFIQTGRFVFLGEIGILCIHLYVRPFALEPWKYCLYTHQRTHRCVRAHT
jgi:hypothetical protein